LKRSVHGTSCWHECLMCDTGPVIVATCTLPLHSWSRAALAACMLFQMAPAAGPKLGWSIHLEKV
jgi:hypothetical protein